MKINNFFIQYNGLEKILFLLYHWFHITHFSVDYFMVMTPYNAKLQLNLLSTTNLIYIILIVALQITFAYPPLFRR